MGAESVVTTFTQLQEMALKKKNRAEFHACNPSYSGDGDQEDHSLRPA
jgi:hypothetical protein